MAEQHIRIRVSTPTKPRPPKRQRAKTAEPIQREPLPIRASLAQLAMGSRGKPMEAGR